MPTLPPTAPTQKKKEKKKGQCPHWQGNKKKLELPYQSQGSLWWRWWWHIEGKKLGELLLDDLLVTEDCSHVGPECIHVLDHGDPMLLGLISKRIKVGSEVLNLVLKGRRRTGYIRCSERWWSLWMGGGWVAGLTRGLIIHAKQGLVCCQFLLIR